MDFSKAPGKTVYRVSQAIWTTTRPCNDAGPAHSLEPESNKVPEHENRTAEKAVLFFFFSTPGQEKTNPAVFFPRHACATGFDRASGMFR
jgi:hypothetical protein